MVLVVCVGGEIAVHLVHIGNYGFNLEHVASWEYEPPSNGSSARLVLYAVVPIGGLSEPNAFAFYGSQAEALHVYISGESIDLTPEENPLVDVPAEIPLSPRNPKVDEQVARRLAEQNEAALQRQQALLGG